MNENFTKLLSAEEVQRAFAEGRDVEFTCDPSRQFGWITPKMHARKNFAQCLAEGYGYRVAVIPKDAPTPEAERPALVGGEACTCSDAQLAHGHHAFCAALTHRGDGLADVVRDVIDGINLYADDDVDAGKLHRMAHHWRKKLEAALSLPAAQDGVTFLCDGTRFKLCPTKGGAAFFNFPAELAGKWVALVDATDNRHMLPTPNAIRGDKGAEAVCPAIKHDPFAKGGVFGPDEKADEGYAAAWAGWNP